MAFGLENYIVNPYLRALIVIIVVFIILRIVVLFIEKFIKKITAKTKTKKDDELIKRASKPFSILIILLGLRLAIEELSLEASVELVIGSIILSFVAIYIAYIVYLIVDIIMFSTLRRFMGKSDSAVKESLLSLMQSALKVILVVVAFLYILDIWGIEIGPFLAGLGIAGIAIAFALQSTLSNIFAGISIILDKSVKVGDLIYLDADTKGKVVHVGLRSTKILTFDNDFLIVPNSTLADSKIQNIGEPEPKSRVVIPFGVAYGTDTDKVKKIVLAELKKIKNFVNDPKPVVRFLEMADSSLNFKAYFYVGSYEHRIGAIDEANTRIYNILNKNKIEIPFPQMDVHVKKK